MVQERGGASGRPVGLDSEPASEAPALLPPAGAPPPLPSAPLPSSGWIADAGTPRTRSRLSTTLTIAAVVIGILVVIGIVGLYLGIFQPRGQVLFGTSRGPNLCSVGGETRTVSSDDPVFFAAVLQRRLGGDAEVRLTITRDGEPYFDNTDPADGTEFECYGSRESIGPLEPGVYVFEVTHDAEVVASGVLTVT